MAALSALLAELQSGDPSRAEQAANALAAHGNLALQELVHLVRTSDANLRWWVVRAFSEFSQEQAGELLVTSLSDPDLAVPGRLEILEQESPQAKAEAVRALALIGDTRAIPALFKNIEADSALVEHWASAGLAKMGVGMNFFET